MTALFKNLPPALLAAHAALQKALDSRSQMLQRQTALAAKEPETARESADAAAAHEAAATELALSTDKNFAELKRHRDEKRGLAAEAAEAHEMVGRSRRGIIQQLAAADAEIEAAHGDWQRAAEPFCDELRQRYRRHLAESTKALVEALRLGHAIDQAWSRSGLSQILREIKINDPVRHIGRVGYLISGHTAWLSEDDDVGDDLRIFDSDPEAAALHALLLPFGRTETAAGGRIRAMQYEKARQPTPQAVPQTPARTAEDIENERIQKMTPEEYKAHRAAVARNNSLYPPYAEDFSYSEYPARRSPDGR
jgi:hypothetical protein